MVESKLWDLSDDVKLDAIVKPVKGKKFTAGVSLISSCLNFLNHCIYIEACTSVGSTRGDKLSATSLAMGSHVFMHAEVITTANLIKFPDTAMSSFANLFSSQELLS